MMHQVNHRKSSRYSLKLMCSKCCIELIHLIQQPYKISVNIAPHCLDEETKPEVTVIVAEMGQ